jgi:hypothetical protein
MMRLLLALPLLLQTVPATPRYAAGRGPRERCYAELRLGIRIEGSDALANFVRSAHPLLSLEKLQVRTEGTLQALEKGRRRLEADESRVELRYDDEDREFDFQRGQTPPGDEDKLKQMMWYLAAGGRTFSVTPEGEYTKEDDANQDSNGEAMDLLALGITRMPAGPVKEGETYERRFDGKRSEKGKKARFAFVQKVTVEKIESKDGRTAATLTSTLTGTLQIPEAERDRSAEEQHTRCEGTTRTTIEVGTGRVLASEGKGRVTVYLRNAAENGSKQELRLSFDVEGRLILK